MLGAILSDHGKIMINVTDRSPLDYARRVLAGVAIAFPHLLLCVEPATLKGRRFGNVIIVGAATPLPYADIAQRVGRVAISVSSAARLTIEATAGRLCGIHRRGCRGVSGARSRPAALHLKSCPLSLSKPGGAQRALRRPPSR